jgi:hypothetical protein
MAVAEPEKKNLKEHYGKKKCMSAADPFLFSSVSSKHFKICLGLQKDLNLCTQLLHLFTFPHKGFFYFSFTHFC